MPASMLVRKVNSAPAVLGSFKLPCREAGEVEAVLSLSMPAKAQFPQAWIAAITNLPEKQLAVMAEDKSKVTGAVIKQFRKENRRKWKQLVDECKADGVKRGDAQDEKNEKEEQHEAQVLQQRWEWLNAQIEGLSHSRWFCDSYRVRLTPFPACVRRELVSDNITCWTTTVTDSFNRKLEACNMLKQWLNSVLLATSAQKQIWAQAQKRSAEEPAEAREEEEKVLALRRVELLREMLALCNRQ